MPAMYGIEHRKTSAVDTGPSEAKSVEESFTSPAAIATFLAAFFIHKKRGSLMMETPFFIHHVGQWRFALFRIPHADGGFQGFADVHDGYDKLCRISLATSFQSQNALGAALSEKCLAWVKDWDARRLVAAGPDSDHSSLQL